MAILLLSKVDCVFLDVVIIGQSTCLVLKMWLAGVCCVISAHEALLLFTVPHVLAVQVFH